MSLSVYLRRSLAGRVGFVGGPQETQRTANASLTKAATTAGGKK